MTLSKRDCLSIVYTHRQETGFTEYLRLLMRRILFELATIKLQAQFGLAFLRVPPHADEAFLFLVSIVENGKGRY